MLPVLSMELDIVMLNAQMTLNSLMVRLILKDGKTVLVNMDLAALS
jgi:hypothetical protein